MKKEFKKKLSLNKQSISKLNQNDLSNVKGGWFRKLTNECQEVSQECVATSPALCLPSGIC